MQSQFSDILVLPEPACDFHAARLARGFTLIELMVVVAIVAILAAIAYPSYQDAVRKSRRGQAKADLVELAQRAERYFTVNNTYAGFEASLRAEDLRSPRTGANIHYVIDRVDDDSVANSFLLDATPQGGQTRDTRCMTLTLNSVGMKDIDGGSASAEDCW